MGHTGGRTHRAQGREGGSREGGVGAAVRSVPGKAMGAPGQSGLSHWSFSSETKLEVGGEGRGVRRERREGGGRKEMGRGKGGKKRGR